MFFVDRRPDRFASQFDLITAGYLVDGKAISLPSENKRSVVRLLDEVSKRRRQFLSFNAAQLPPLRTHPAVPERIMISIFQRAASSPEQFFRIFVAFAITYDIYLHRTHRPTKGSDVKYLGSKEALAKSELCSVVRQINAKFSKVEGYDNMFVLDWLPTPSVVAGTVSD
jgi:hypothetical protein